MPKYICFFSYTREAGKAMIEKPTDRVAAAKALVESVGGKMECFYWMHGHHDGFFIADYQDGDVWATAWKKGPGSRHEMFGKLGIKCRTFRDSNNPNATGLMAEIPDMAKFQELLRSDEGQKAMREDGLKVDTMRMLVEFTP